MDRWTSLAASRRVRVMLSGALTLAMVLGASFYLARSVFFPDPASGGTAVDQPGTRAMSPSPRRRRW